MTLEEMEKECEDVGDWEYTPTQPWTPAKRADSPPPYRGGMVKCLDCSYSPHDPTFLTDGRCVICVRKYEQKQRQLADSFEHKAEPCKKCGNEVFNLGEEKICRQCIALSRITPATNRVPYEAVLPKHYCYMCGKGRSNVMGKPCLFCSPPPIVTIYKKTGEIVEFNSKPKLSHKDGGLGAVEMC